ncbi:MAG: hypothetical protein M3527_07545 [Actinomycetota bacterium]|nr:hypothetical protein [Acidimicrobiia bacterium]MDQ3294287.1 hypothetical protein [Actinomycetota bacterium]
MPADTTPGASVEVWNRSLSAWCGPFQVTQADADGVVVRRMDERQPLPHAFPHAAIRTPRPTPRFR